MTVTPSELYLRAGRILGSREGTVGTVTVGASTTTAVLTGLKNLSGDPMKFGGDVLYLPDSSAGSREVMIQTWNDLAGTALFTNQTDPPTANERYMVWNREDYTLTEYQYALDKALLETPRTYRKVIPFTPLLREYPLTDLDWLTGAGDIDSVNVTMSPLMLHNEDMSLWQNGTALAPDGYTLTGTGATIARVSGGVRSNYAALITAGAGVARLTQAIPASLVQWATRRTFPVFYPFRAAAWASTTDASSVRVFIYDGTTYHYSDYIDADGVPHFPELSLTPDATMTAFTWGIEIAASKSVRLSWAGLMQNTITFSQAFQIKDSGSQAAGYQEQSVPKAIRNIGGSPYVELPSFPATWGQLVVYCRRPFPLRSSDADEYEDQYARVLTAGLLNFLLEATKPGQDRARFDAIRAREMRIWTRLSTNITDLPVPEPPGYSVVRGW